MTEKVESVTNQTQETLSSDESLNTLLNPRKLSLRTANGINRAAHSVAYLYGGDITQATTAVIDWFKANKNVRRSTFRYRMNHSAPEKSSTGNKVYTGPIINYEDEK